MGPPSEQPAIEEHAAIGDGRSVALVTSGGEIDWLCWPRFDSQAVFASILDPIRGGSFSVEPTGSARVSRRYLPETNVLETTFQSESGVLSLTDLMTLESEYEGQLAPEHELLREARCLSGSVEVAVRFDPRPNYGLDGAALKRAGIATWRVQMGARVLLLRAAVIDSTGRATCSSCTDGEPLLLVHPDGGLAARLTLAAGERFILSLVWAESAPAVLPSITSGFGDRIARTVAWWQDWTARRRYEGPYRAEVIRSALVLKLLGFAPSGAVVAAPTTSLPERPGGDLNWDYRFCWLRDAALTIRALYGLGCPEEARAFVSWLLHTTRMHLPRVRVLYDVYGRRPPPERELNLAGWRGAGPVRVGNGAMDQLQLDVFGEVIDAVVRFAEAESTGLDRETRRLLRSMGEWVCRNWELPDAGIWEPRDVLRRHTHSAAMCWVALDGLLRLHEDGLLPQIPGHMFKKNRELLRQAVEIQGFDQSLGAYTQAFGDRELDSAVLRLPALGYVSADAPRMKATVSALRKHLNAGSGLIYRYTRSITDREGAFVVCSFWLADALARGAGSLAEARESFEETLQHANDVGLFAEEVDPEDGAALGNFPQAYSHVGLVNAAISIKEREATEARCRRATRNSSLPAPEVRE